MIMQLQLVCSIPYSLHLVVTLAHQIVYSVNILHHITYIAKKYFLVYLLSFWYEIEFSFAFFDIWEFGHNVNTQLNTYQIYGHLYTI